jgi:hypothetical protein
MHLKQRIWQGGLVVLCAWPLAHYAVVQCYGVSPWKLHGMAMYCEPKLRESAALFGVRNGRERPVRGAPEALIDVVDEHLKARRALGAFASRDALKEEARRHVAPGDGLLLEVEHWSLDPDSRRARATATRHTLVQASLAGIDARGADQQRDLNKESRR